MRIPIRNMPGALFLVTLALASACSPDLTTSDRFRIFWDVELGSQQGSSEVRFASVEQVRCGPDGLIFAADRLQSDIKVFGKESRLSLTIWKPGRGARAVSGNQRNPCRRRPDSLGLRQCSKTYFRLWIRWKPDLCFRLPGDKLQSTETGRPDCSRSSGSFVLPGGPGVDCRLG